MLTIYGIPKSRAFRCIWAAEEAGIAYAIEPVSFGADSKTPEFLAINPNGKVPAMRDGELLLFESLAICLHIARRAGGHFNPGEDDASRVLQWTLWAAAEIEPSTTRWSYNTFVLPPEKRVPAEAEAGERALIKSLGVLEQHLEGRDWLVGGAFSVADLVLAAVLLGAYSRGADLSTRPKVKAWLARCFERPAAKRALAMREG